MRPLRFLPAVVLAVGAFAVASHWDTVIGAYSGSPAPSAEIQFTGVDLRVEPTPIEPSPFWFAPAPDTRDVPVELAYLVDEEVAAPILHGGSALLQGTVAVPDGPAGGAVIRLERHTGGGMAVTDVVADPLGRWKAPDLQGGRYRVRAWVPGQATMADSDVFFLGAEESRTLGLTVQPVDATPRMRFDHRGDIFVGGTGTVAVSVTIQSVDGDGFVVVSGLAGAVVTLVPSGPMTVAGAATVVADGDGVARFVLSCPAAGSGSAVVTHESQSLSVVLPSCVEPPPPITPPPVTLAVDPTASTTTTTGSGAPTPTVSSPASQGASVSPPATATATPKATTTTMRQSRPPGGTRG